MTNPVQSQQSPRARQSGGRVRRFVRTSIKPVVIRLTRRLSVTFWPNRRRSISLKLAALLVPFVPGFAGANPTGGQVVAGSASISRPNSSSMQILQGSQNAIINWQSFSIGAGESVRFVQPGSTSVALNRVVGGDPSRIFGSLSANGQVFLVNSSGVYFAPGAHVSVGGLVATSLNVSDANFMAGKYKFEAGANAGSVVNEGDLRGTYVTLAAPKVTNAGSIDTSGGATALAAGGKVSLDIAGDKLVSLNVDAATADAAIANSGSIRADGGKVFMTANSANAVLDTVINTSGIVRAASIGMRDGQIVIDGGGAGVVSVSGTLAADGAAAGTKGGTVKVLGDKVGLFAGANVDVSGQDGGGTALIGGNFHGTGSERNASFTEVDKAAVIRADAVSSGAGGNVAVWADQHTRFQGTVSAQGGANGGDGGFIETSGKGSLAFAGKVDTRAAKGKRGTLLLDPSDITITGSGTSGDVSGGPSFGGSADNSNLSVSDLQAALSVTNVIVDASTGPGNGSGNIAVNAAVTWLDPSSLTLKASGNITISNAMFSGGGGGIALNADGAVNINAGIDLAGGNLTIGGSAGAKAGSLTNTAAITTSGGNVVANVAGAVVTGNIDSATGTIALRSDSGISVNSTLTSDNATTSAIVLQAGKGRAVGDASAGGDITIAGGGINLTGGGRATLYTGSIAGSTGVDTEAGSGSGHFRYNSDASTTNFTTALGSSGVYAVYREQPTLTVTTTGGAITYGDTAPAMTATTTGMVNGDTEALALSGTWTADHDHNLSTGGYLTAGSHVVSASGAADQLGYHIAFAPGAITVAAKAVTVSGLTALNKTYDGNATATFDNSGAIVTGVLSGDVAAATGIGTFSDKNAGTNKLVTLIPALAGADGANYTVTGQTTATADITQKSLTVGGITVAPKVYDGNTTATVNTGGATFTGIVGSDDVHVSATGVFADKNVGTNKAVTLSSNYSGADAGNYTFVDQTAATGNITPKAVTVGGITASDKVYDGGTTATVSAGSASISGLVGSDDVHVSATGVFADKNAGSNKLVTLTSSYSGADAGNYTFTDQAVATANITPAALTVGGITASGKVYDGTTTATINTGGATFTGIIGSDDVQVSMTGAFADKNAGTGKTVNLTGSYSGADAGNYTITGQTTATADITPRTLTVGGITAVNKVYDGTTTAALDISGASLTGGVVGGDDVSLGATGSFVNKNVGLNKTVNLTGSLVGTDAGNYTVTGQTTATADITPKALTISGITVDTKVYDGTTNATVNTGTASYVGLVGGDNVQVNAIGLFTDKNVGTNKTVNLVSSYSGADAGNYAVTGQSIASADITPKTLTISGITAGTKTYDGTTGAVLDASGTVYGGLVLNDDVQVNVTGAFADKNVGVNKSVVLNSTHSGADLGNYNIVDQGTATADITPKTLTVSGITAANKVYDGTTIAILNTGGASLGGGVVSGDDVSLGATGTFSNKNAGAGKTVSLTGSLSGADAGNYVLAGQTSTTADITQKLLTITGITVTSKEYDGTTSATVNTVGASYGGLVTGDDVHVNAAGVFADKNAGTGKSVALVSSYSGTDLANYSVTGQANATGNITPKALTLSGITASSKVYDGTTVAVVNTGGAHLAGIIGSDDVQVSATGAFADKNAGTNKSVLLSTSYSGADAGNYTFGGQTGVTADITPKALTVGGLAVTTRAYNGGVSATVDTSQATLAGLVTGDHVTVNSTGTFADKNVGTGKAVALSTTYGGADGGNYSFAGQTSATGTITRLDSVVWVGGGTTSKWSEAANWAGGAIPDMQNVAHVSIPASSTVIFDNTVAMLNGAVRVDAVDGGGSLGILGGALNVANSLGVASFSQTSGTLNAGSLSASRGFTQTGGSMDIAGAIDITQLTNFTTLGNMHAGSLSVNAPGGVRQAAGSAITVDGVTTFAGGDITLANANNNFNSVVLTDVHSAVLNDTNAMTVSGTTGADLTTTSNGLRLGATNVGGSLNATSSGGMDQSAALTVTGAASFTGSNGEIKLTDTGNTFAGGVTLNGGAAQLAGQGPLAVHLANGDTSLTAVGSLSVDGTVTGALHTNSAGLTLGGIHTPGTQFAAAAVAPTSLNISGDLSITATGAIDQAGALTVGGSTSILASGQQVALTNSANSFGGPITLTSKSAQLAGAGALAGQFTTDGALTLNAGAVSFGVSTVGGDLTVTSSGNVTETGPLTVAGAASIDAGTHAVTLTNAGNDMRGTLTVKAASADVHDKDNLTVVNTNGARLTTGGDLTVQSAGTQDLGASTVGGKLIVTAAGDVTQSGALTVTGTSAIDAGTHTVALTNAGNDFVGAVSGNGASVALKDSNVLTLGKIKASTVNLTGATGLAMVAGGLIDAPNIQVTMPKADGIIGTSAALIAVQPGASVVFGNDSAAVDAYFSGFPLPVFSFVNHSTEAAYSNHKVSLWVDNKPRQPSTESVRAAINSGISHALMAAQKKADSYNEVIEEGLPLDLSEQPAYPHSGQLTIRMPVSQEGAPK